MSAAGPNDTDPTHPGNPPARDNTRLTAPVRRPYPFLAPPHAPDELGRLGDYRVTRLLGVGGMGYVFEAEELALRRRVALKVLKPELAFEAENRERFLREARAAAAVESDHVVTIYHVVDAETPYLAMQFLEGESLQSRIENGPPITLRAALEIARQAAEGLAAAHEKRLVHRDVKPANLWLEAPHGRVKLLDFGLARRSAGETSLTSTGFIVGTPNFMAPEQASGADVDPRADLFSLGCVLYTLLTGEQPFQGSTAMAVMMALANKAPAPADVKNPAVPAEVAAFVHRLLEKDPVRRPQSAREAAAALDALLGRISGSLSLPSSGARHPPNQHGKETPLPGRGETIPAQFSAGPQPPAKPTARGRVNRLYSRRTALVIGAGAAAGAGVALWEFFRPTPPGPIVIGVLHSQTGTMAVSERPVLHATLLAAEEIKADGGLLGRQIDVVVADGKSDPDEFARQAESLLDRGAVALFGCWTSPSRKAVRDVLLRRNEGLLFYPVQYEGLEHSSRIVYLGPTPNQQLLPALDFLADKLGKRRLFVVGSDYIFPRAVHELVKDWVKKKAEAGVPVQVLGAEFLPLGSTQVVKTVTDIERKEPDAIINAINGGTNVHFFANLRERGLTPDKLPTLSLSLTENEVRGLNPGSMAGDYLAASYFQAADRPEGREFLHKFKERYEGEPVATDPAAAAYTGVKLWAKAAEKAGSTDPAEVTRALRGVEFEGVRARVRIDPETQHAWLPSRVGKIRPDGRVELVAGAGSEVPLPPVPYPPFRSREEWEAFLLSWQLRWDGKWQAPENKPAGNR